MVSDVSSTREGRAVEVDASGETPEVLAVRAAQGSHAAFAELVALFEVRLYNFLLRRTRSRTDAEELTQESFARAWQSIKSYDPAWKFSTWLFTIGSRLAVSDHRKQGRMRTMDTSDSAAGGMAGMMGVGGIGSRGESGGRMEGIGEERMEHRLLGRALWALAGKTLKDDQQTALWLRYGEDMSIGEVATVMGKSQVAVRVMLFRARQTLATAFAKGDDGARLGSRLVEAGFGLDGAGDEESEGERHVKSRQTGAKGQKLGAGVSGISMGGVR